MLSAAYDGHESQHAPTLAYMSYRWRKEMHATPEDFRKTPIDVVRRDLEYIAIERTIERSKSQQN
ncbi:hypothetical protein GTC6_05222 [Gordonia terrae C-6]|uniref:Uncharacterized protein n=1 Tax=Gordonia terrae C-6 TaxID=1316928 RepID=R7YCL6_9ACTN|nr:hypothetical protein GTC6_05222 [Gordonia terrae C-6]